MTATVDLATVPVVDNHCHGIYRTGGPETLAAWRACFTEAPGARTRSEFVATTLFYTKLVRDLAGFLACEPDEGAVFAARQSWDRDDLVRALLQDADIEALIVDQGYPSQDRVLPDAQLSALTGCRTAPMLRLESLMQELIAQHARLDATIDALHAALDDLRGQGYVALKTIAAYRTGLAIRTWPLEDAEAGFAQARLAVAAQGHVRLAHQPLLDTLLHVAFARAAEQELPVQFHTGYGDPDADLRLGNPLYLRGVLERAAYRGMPVVLLHESYPYTREGAYLAASYDQVYLDLSYGLPPLGYSELLACTRAALAVAPYAKLLYSSDGVGLPEIHWSSARAGRKVLAQVLSESIAQGDLTPAQAQAAGEALLRGNAVRLYGL